MRVSLCVNYHSEGLLARKSALSALKVKEFALQMGIQVELVAVIDRPDVLTKTTIEQVPFVWDKVIYPDCGDLGQARNIATDQLESEFVSFLDGDDLCGMKWLVECWNFWINEGLNEAILHPEYVYYFDERDFTSDHAMEWRRSFWFRQVSTSSSEFQAKALGWNNVFTSNNFTSRNTLKQNPLPSKCVKHGYGVEDWSWNYTTYSSGIEHLVVPNTVHLVRVSDSESLSSQNTKLHLLPDLDKHWEFLH